MVEQLKSKAAEKQQVLVLAEAEKKIAEPKNSAPATAAPSKRRGPPPGVKSSGLVLELVPIEPPQSD
jgi:hypothetical protein